MKKRQAIKTRPPLTCIDAGALAAAIAEFNRLGRLKFLAAYGFSRSSKFYVFHDQKIYDAKTLVAAAYRHATKIRLGTKQFSGGDQTNRVYQRIKRQGGGFEDLSVFEDELGELRNLSGEYDRAPRAFAKVQELGFSQWIPLSKIKQLHTGSLPGVYVVAASPREPAKITIVDPCTVYIGETVDQSLYGRLYQLHHSVKGKTGHSGGITLARLGFGRKRLWISIRSFPLAYGMTHETARILRATQIRSLERRLLHEYVLNNNASPMGNSK